MDIPGAPSNPNTEVAAPVPPQGSLVPPQAGNVQQQAPQYTPPPAAPAFVPQQQAPAYTKKALSADDDSIPDDAEMFEISKQALKKRLERANRSQLKSAFGTDNVEEILAWKQQSEEYKQREEEARLASMTESERYRTQYEKAQYEAEQWRQQYESLQENYIVREQDTQMTSIGSKYIDPSCMDFVMQKFAQHVQSVDDSEIGDPHAFAEAWISGFIQANPKFGSAPVAPPAPAMPAISPYAAPPVRTVPFSNGTAPSPRPGIAVGTVPQKSLAPGQPNSMTSQEARQHARQLGYNY